MWGGDVQRWSTEGGDLLHVSVPARVPRSWWSTALVAVAALVLAACGSSSAPTPNDAAAASSGSTPSVAARVRLSVTQESWRLPAAVSRPVVLAAGDQFVVAGGLRAGDQSRSQVHTIDPTSGRVTASGNLSTPVHDAAGAVLSGRSVVFGGGATTSLPTVQTIARRGRGTVIGTLPRPRSDLTSVTVDGAAYLLGGYDGTVVDRSVLMTTDGVTFQQVAQLPVGVRYASAAAVGHVLWVFGGERNGVPVDLIQRVDLTTGRSRVAGHLPRPISHASAVTLQDHVYLAGGLTTGARRTAAVLRFDPVTHGIQVAGRLPSAVSDAGAVVVGDAAYLVGGETPGFSRAVTTLTLVSAPMSTASGDVGTSPSSSEPPWLAPPTGRGHLAAGSDPSVLPGGLLIADKLNNRLVVVDPNGRVRWQFPRPGDLLRGQTFRIPDDAFFSPDGTQIIATQEDDFVVTVIDIATHQILYRYGTPGVPGSGPNQLNNPDDAFLLPNHDILTPDIKNCRILRIHQGQHRPAAVYGTTGSCYHSPPGHFGSPNGAFPLPNGNFIVTEIQGGWVDEMTPTGKVLWSVQVPGVSYPSDTNQLPNGRFVTVDYSTPGQVVVFDRSGHASWRYAPQGPRMLRQPSLARPLPNGDLLVTDDANHRVIVIDPRTNRIVWQYGHTGVAGRAPGYLDHPDGLDLLPPDQLASLMVPAQH